jgi:hypothetical protein
MSIGSRSRRSNQSLAASFTRGRRRSLIAQEAKTSPGVDTNVDVDRVQDIIDQTWTSWEKEHCVWLKSANWCIHQGENKRIEAFLPNSKTLRLEGMKKGAGYCAICEVSECTYDFNGLPLPVCTSLYAQEAIASAAKTSPAVEVDPVSEPIAQVAETCPGVEVYRTEEPIMETAETCPGVEVDRVQEPIVPVAETCPGVEVDRVQEPIIEMVETFPAASVEQAQEAIAPAAKNLPGSRLKTSTAHQLLELFKSSAHIIEDFPGVKTEVTVSESAIAPAAKISLAAEPDLNPILTGVCLSDRFLAHYSPPQPENIRFQSEADGQLSLLNFEVVTESEPPDPDDFETLDAFRERSRAGTWNIRTASSVAPIFCPAPCMASPAPYIASLAPYIASLAPYIASLAPYIASLTPCIASHQTRMILNPSMRSEKRSHAGTLKTLNRLLCL